MTAVVTPFELAPWRTVATAGPALIVLLAVTSGACAARGGVPRPFPGASLPPGAREAPSDRAEAPGDQPETPPTIDPFPRRAASPTITTAVAAALEYLGVPYRNGGSDPAGFDCSGFVQYVFARIGAMLPREVHDQYRVGREIDFDDVRAGDLLFFETVSRGASHVGMALGDGRFVHAPSSRGVVRVEPYTASYWARRFVGARRVTEVIFYPGGGLFPGSVRSSR